MIDALRRYGLIAAVAIGTLVLFGTMGSEYWNMIRAVIIAECVAIVLTSIGQYAYTSIAFDKAYTDTERLAHGIVLAGMAIAVHLLVAGVCFGVYFTMFGGDPSH